MNVDAVSRHGSESPSRFTLKDKLEKLQSFTVDRQTRWPVQGWSSGEESDNYDIHYDLATEECLREFRPDSDTRWPLQGWCKAQRAPMVPKKSSAQSRWPQGW